MATEEMINMFDGDYPIPQVVAICNAWGITTQAGAFLVMDACFGRWYTCVTRMRAWFTRPDITPEDFPQLRALMRYVVGEMRAGRPSPIANIGELGRDMLFGVDGDYHF